ncbi:MAG: ScyD/ScyE family protein [Nocardioides sp.]
MKRTMRSLALLSTAAMAGSLALASPAQAAPQRADGETLASHMVSALSLAVAKDGTVYAADNFRGSLVALKGKAAPYQVYQSTEKNAEVGAVSTYAKNVTFTITGQKKLVMQWKQGDAKAHMLANVGAYEAKKNPDKGQAYGLVNPSAECVASWPVKQAGPPTYTGVVDSHPYSTYTTSKGVYVGEAAGNDILWIDNAGKIKTIAVLPTTDVVISAAASAELKIPACAGATYRLEPVPTDVELGPDGWLYVSSLPGGPESAALGANGRVYKVNPKSGKVKMVATGFVGTVDLAVANNGDIYVAQLFAGEISKIKSGSSTPKTFLKVNMPGAVEWTKDALYYTENAVPSGKTPKGKVIRLPW